MSHVKVKELREKRNELVTKAQALLEKDKLTKDEEAQFDLLMLDADKVKVEIDRWERMLTAQTDLNTRIEHRAGRENMSLSEAKEDDEKALIAFSNWVRGGMDNVTPDEKLIMMGRAGFAPSIKAAQSVGTTTAGGFLVPQAFSDRLEIAEKFYAGMLQEAEIITTDSGADMPWPTVNDTTQVGAILAENATIPAQDITFASVTLKAYMYTSKLIAVSWQLLQDSAFSIDNLVADLAGQRLGRILNTHFTTGTGSGQPNGIVTAAASGKVGTTGQTTSVIYDDLVDLVYSIDIAYRAASKWMMNDASVKVVRKLKDSQGRPLWEPSLQAGQPDRLLGYPIVTNNDVATMAANAKSILFGSLTKYKVRQVRGVSLVRLNERYADNLQVGFFAFTRYDGNLIDAGTNPVKYYANSAT